MSNNPSEGYHTGRMRDWKVLSSDTSGGRIYKFLARCVFTSDGVEHDLKADILLAGKTGPNMAQINALKESLGWSGDSLTELQDGDYSGMDLTFKVEDRGQYGFQVTWINRPRGYRKLGREELAGLDAEWKVIQSPPASASFGKEEYKY